MAGNYLSRRENARSALREHAYAGAANSRIGFRLALEIPSADSSGDVAAIHADDSLGSQSDRSAVDDIPEDRWTDWTNLFDSKTLNGLERQTRGCFAEGTGEVSVNDGKLVLSHTGGFGIGIASTLRVPTVDYEVNIEAMRIEGLEFASLHFPFHESAYSLSVGSGADHVVGIWFVDGKRGDENATTRRIAFKNNRWYRIRLRVCRRRIQAWIDGEQMFDLSTESSKLTPDDFQAAAWNHSFGVYGVGMAGESCRSVVRAIQIRSLRPETGIASGKVLALPMERPAPRHVALNPEGPPSIEPSQPLSRMAPVAQPGPANQGRGIVDRGDRAEPRRRFQDGVRRHGKTPGVWRRGWHNTRHRHLHDGQTLFRAASGT